MVPLTSAWKRWAQLPPPFFKKMEMQKLNTVRKEDLQKMIERLPDGTQVLILTTVQDVGRALAATATAADPADKRDQSEVVLAIEGPMAYDQAGGVYYLVAGHLEGLPVGGSPKAGRGGDQLREVLREVRTVGLSPGAKT